MQNEPIEVVNYKGYEIKIYPDDNSENPREWDNLGTIYYQNDQYILGEKVIKDEFDVSNCNNWNDIEKLLIKELNPAVIIPLKIYDHSGVSISTAIHSYPFNDYWDSSFIGFILVTKEQVRKEYNVKKISKKLKEQVTRILEQEIKTFDQFMNGEIYGYVIEPEETEKQLKPEITMNSCWGYYELDYAISEAKNVIYYEIEEQRKNKQLKVKTLIKKNVPLIKRQEILI
jgi:hypothetical protein